MGMKRTPEALAKFKKSMRKRWADPEFKTKMIESFKGRIVSEETRRKISKAHITISTEQEEQIIKLYESLTVDEISLKLNLNRAVIYSCLHRHKIQMRPMRTRMGKIPWNKGIELSEEQKANLNMEGLELGRAWNKGIPASKESINRLRTGLQNWIDLKGCYPNWQGGISFEPYSAEFNNQLKYKIRERDNFTCQKCGKKENGKAHDCHHKNYNKKDSRPENLTTLCASCHMKTNGNRDYWLNYFKMKEN